MTFYRDVLKFAYDRKVDVPDDYGFFFKISDALELFIGKHSKVFGKNPQPIRHIFDLQVEDVKGEFEKIKKSKSLVVIAPPFQAPCSLVATFTDPEGNCWQFSEATSETCEFSK